MLEKGGNPNVVDWKGMNALSYALKKDNYDLAFVILKQSQYKIRLNQFVEVISH